MINNLFLIVLIVIIFGIVLSFLTEYLRKKAIRDLENCFDDGIKAKKKMNNRRRSFKW